jgi:putative aldouronate transport system substrate-binding protein
MKKLKLTKIVALLLVLIMSFMVACAPAASNGAAPTPASPDTPATSGTPAETNDEDEPGAADGSGYTNRLGFELRDIVLDFRLGGAPSLGVDRISAAINEHLASIGRPYTVDLSFHDFPEYWDGTVNLILSTGEPVDGMFIAEWAGAVRTQATVGTLMALNPWLEAYPEIEQVLTAPFMNANNIRGNTYALPTNKEIARTTGWVARKDIVDAMGMDVSQVRNLDDLEPWLYKAAEEHDMWIFAWSPPVNFQWDGLIRPLISFYPFEDTVIFEPLHPATIEGYHRIARWNADGLMNPNRNIDSFAEGEYLAGHTWITGQQLKPGKDAEMAGGLGMEFVQMEFNVPEISMGETNGSMVTIPAGSVNPNEAFDFILLTYTDPVIINLIMFGEAGIDFNYVDQGRGIITLLDSDWNNSGNAWTLGNQLNNYVTDLEDPNKWQAFAEFNAAARPLRSLGFVPDLTDPQVETWIAAARVIEERFFDLIRGLTPPDMVDAEIERLRSEAEAAGIFDLVAEIQRQFDEWDAAQ